MKTLLLLFITVLFSFESSFAQQQFQNGSFEDWEEVGLGPDNMEPVNWSSIKTGDNQSVSNVAPVVWGISDDAHHGNYSLHLFNSPIVFGIIATGTVTNGRVHANVITDSAYMFTQTDDERWYSSFTWRPDSVVGWYKSNSASGDFGTLKIALHTGELHMPGDESNIVAVAYHEFPSEVQTEWKRFSIPFEYFKTTNPEYYLSILTSGNGVDALEGSEIWFDDLKFIYLPNSVIENKFDDISIFASNGNISVLLNEQNNYNYKIIVNDIMGHQIYNGDLLQNEETIKINDGLSAGIYVVTIISGSDKYSKKLLID